jgi:NAD(P)-dependent dehydrogenase (short-subunit alcohol dehydrogenase family)
MKLAGKCALVTGAGTGIGREVAIEFARQGADVVLSYHGSRDGALSAVAEIEKLGRRAAAYQADVGIVGQCYALVDQAVAFLGQVDVLVNNAGVTLHKDFFEITEADFDYLYGLNIRGEYFCAQQAARNMRAHGGGVIINMLSIHGLVSYPQHSLYDGTKGAIAAMTRSLAIELGPQHIRVVGVAPGAIEVPRYYQEDPHYSREELARQIPCQHVGMPIDIAKLCAFLASDDAGFIVGTTVVCDGGTTSRMAL